MRGLIGHVTLLTATSSHNSYHPTRLRPYLRITTASRFPIISRCTPTLKHHPPHFHVLEEDLNRQTIFVELRLARSDLPPSFIPDLKGYSLYSLCIDSLSLSSAPQRDQRNKLAPAAPKVYLVHPSRFASRISLISRRSISSVPPFRLESRITGFSRESNHTARSPSRFI